MYEKISKSFLKKNFSKGSQINSHDMNLNSSFTQANKKNEDNIDDIKAEVKEINIKLKDSVKDEMKELAEEVHEKLDEIENESKVNARHVDNLRELNKTLLERINDDVQGE